MDNVKMGALIKELRKERGMTQKDLAELLHVTDRAVSKWEHGLCAPDISLLEPLAEALDISILELIQGQRRGKSERSSQLEESTKTVLDYSKSEIDHKLEMAKRKHRGIAAGVLFFLALFCGAILWRSGLPFVIDRSVSPDGNRTITVYSKELESGGFGTRNATSLIVQKGSGEGEWRINYGDCAYQGVWWAPDSRKYVLALKYPSGTQFALAWLDRNSESNLNAYLSMGVEMTELSKYGYARQGGFPDIEYQFLQWARDSASMLIHYSFEDAGKEVHEGYFWYNCENGTVSAILELNR